MSVGSAPTSSRPTPRPGWTSILRHALRWRRAAALVLLAVGTVAVAAAAAGPIFLARADAYSLRTGLAQGIAAGRASVSVAVPAGHRPDASLAAAGAVLRHGAGARGDLFAQPTYSAERSTSFAAGPQGASTSVFWQSGFCAHLRFVAGTCPRSTDQTAISSRSLRQLRLQVGARVSATGFTHPLRIVGVYQVPRLPLPAYWNGVSRFACCGLTHTGSTIIDDLMATEATVLGGTNKPPGPALGMVAVARPGPAQSVGLAAVQSAFKGIRGALAAHGLTVQSPLPAVLAQIGHEDNLAAIVVEAVMLQLLLLAVVVLFTVVATGSRERTAEMQIARRRGFSRVDMFRFANAETLLLLLVCLPLGLVAGWLVIALTGSRILPGTRLGLPAGGILAALGAFVVAVIACSVASWDLWRGNDTEASQSSSRNRAVAGITLSGALAAAGLLAMLAHGALSGAGGTLAAAGPALLALGVGVLALWLLARAATAAVRPTADSARVSLFLAVRSLARRRPSALGQLLPIALAAAVAVFALSTWQSANHNRTSVALVQHGASRILDVSTPEPGDLQSLVDRADPGGHAAMAAVLFAGSNGTTLAVDPSRLTAVMPWPHALSRRSQAQIARYLQPKTAAPVAFAGSRLRVTAGLRSPKSLQLTATVYDRHDQLSTIVTLPTIKPGQHTYAVSLAGSCVRGCLLTSLEPSGSKGSPSQDVGLTLSLAAHRGGGWRPIDLGPAATWRGSSGTTNAPGGALAFTIPARKIQTNAVSLAPATLPPVIPAVVTDLLASSNVPTPPEQLQPIPGLDGNLIQVSGKVTVPALPGVGEDGAMMDLEFAQLSQISPSLAQPQVWLSPDAPASVVRRLRSLGVHIQSSSTDAPALSASNRTPLAEAYRFGTFAVPIAALLAIGTAAFGLISSSRRRRAERRALKVSGISSRSATVSVLVENGVALLLALIAGSVAGLVVGRLAIASLPSS